MLDATHYNGHKKYRCILRVAYDPAYAYEHKRRELRADGLTAEETELIIGASPAALDATALIRRAVEYVFDANRAGNYVEGRFNTRHFPALYTAKETGTAEAERRHHWLNGSQSAPFVIFSVYFTGRARDIRPEVAVGGLPFPEEFGPSQKYAQEAIDAGFDAIAAPSKRSPNGSCCAIFTANGVAYGATEQFGSFS